jgi:hypothetical protein
MEFETGTSKVRTRNVPHSTSNFTNIFLYPAYSERAVLTWVFIETHIVVKYLAFLLRICHPQIKPETVCTDCMYTHFSLASVGKLYVFVSPTVFKMLKLSKLLPSANNHWKSRHD